MKEQFVLFIKIHYVQYLFIQCGLISFKLRILKNISRTNSIPIHSHHEMNVENIQVFGYYEENKKE